MAISLRSAVTTTALLASTLLMHYVPADAWLAPIISKGNKFFNPEAGEEFRVKGIAYLPAIMCAASEAGICVLVELSAPCENCAIIDALPPKCYPEALFARAQMIYNQFVVYDNTLGFSVGNEHNFMAKYGENGTATAPCVKALLRDTRSYAVSCSGSLREVPIGLDIADTLPRGQ